MKKKNGLQAEIRSGWEIPLRKKTKERCLVSERAANGNHPPSSKQSYKESSSYSS